MGWMGYGGPLGGTYYHAQAPKLRVKPELNPKPAYNLIHGRKRPKTETYLFTF